MSSAGFTSLMTNNNAYFTNTTLVSNNQKYAQQFNFVIASGNVVVFNSNNVAVGTNAADLSVTADWPICLPSGYYITNTASTVTVNGTWPAP
jgi:hypothetical protein